MANTYPTSLNTHKKDWANDTPVQDAHPEEHNDIASAVEALEAKVGADSSAVTTSHDYKLSGVTGSDKAASKTGTETFTNKTLTNPIISLIYAAASQVSAAFASVASAVNYVKFTGSATGNDVDIAPDGTDTNVGIKIKGKGSGKVKLGDAELQFPDVDGSASQALTTNASGVLQWSSVVTPTIGVGTSSPLSVTTNGTQKIIVWAKATHITGASGNNTSVTLSYNAVAKDTVQVGDVTGRNDHCALMYTETPTAGTRNITIATASGSLQDIVIMYMLVG